MNVIRFPQESVGYDTRFIQRTACGAEGEDLSSTLILSDSAGTLGFPDREGHLCFFLF